MFAYLFPGQGSQFRGMGQDLFQSCFYPHSLEQQIDAILGYSVREMCLQGAENQLRDTAITQPCLYIVNALHHMKCGADGRRAEYYAGHSLGEYNALLAAGAFDILTGLRLVARRGQLMAAAPSGTMAAVIGMRVDDVARVLGEHGLTGIDIANFNTPLQVVISGPAKEIQQAESAMMPAGASRYIPLQVSAPFHSRYMEAPAKEFAEFTRTIEFKPLHSRVISNVTARPYPMEGGESTRALLVQQIHSQVRWSTSVGYIKSRGVNEFIECGPGTVLTRMLSQIPALEPESETGDADEAVTVEAAALELPHTANIADAEQGADSEKSGCSLLQRRLIDLVGGRLPGSIFRFLEAGTSTEREFYAKSLATLALSAAPALHQKVTRQGCVIIALPVGPEFIASLFACFAANVIAVPMPLASDQATKQEQAHLDAIQEQLERRGPVLVLGNGSTTLNTFAATGRPGRVFAAKEDDIALILFTSASSGDPKGVLLSHGACWHQALAGASQWKMTAASSIATWLSPAHNFGLHFGVLAPLVSDAASMYIRPQDFMRKTVWWLETLQRIGVTHIAAPNFAFDFLAGAVPAEKLPVDALAGVTNIICGGEPVRRCIVERFIEKFAGAGAHAKTFCAHYGLSETGSLATQNEGAAPAFFTLDASELLAGRVAVLSSGQGIDLANCGRPPEDITIRIVHPDTAKTCAPNETGEIWVRSHGLASGYLGDTEATQSAFGWTIEDTGETGFFRTGDRGFLHQGYLYIAGREKEIIIVRGKNHFPSHIEMTISAADADHILKPVVFGAERNGEESITALVEVDGTPAPDALAALAVRIRSRVARTHGAAINELIFFEKGKLLAPGAGKLNRRVIRDAYLAGKLENLWADCGELQSAAVRNDVPEGTTAILREEVFAKVLGARALQFGSGDDFSGLGLDSMQCLRLSGEIENVFGIPFEPTLLFKYSTLSETAAHIDNLLHGGMKSRVSPGASQSASGIHDPIAIIGMHCEVPGAGEGVEALWKFLMAGGDGISRIESKRPKLWMAMQRYPWGGAAGLPEWAGLLEDIDRFDAEFFGISRREAECMDPQQRKMLEFIWKLSEASGYNPASLNGERIGIFVAAHAVDYGELLAARTDLMADSGAYIDSGSHLTMIPNRVSRWFNFTGPSEVINTACSSSLVALHHAVGSLQRRECTSAMVAGINLILTPRVLLSSAKAGMLAPDGRCRTLDSKASGFVRSEGVAGVFLKPLSRAVAEGDTVLGVIRGIGVNHDGRSNSLRAPNIKAQKALLMSTYTEAGVDPATVSYVELHGTGTPLGDPIEMQALGEAYQEMNPGAALGSCGVGSIKSNIGHLEPAAGLAGLINVLLAMQHEILPSTLHFRQINPLIDLRSTPFYVVAEHTPWSCSSQPRRAGVSSFGFGGVNSHVIVEEYIPAGISAAVTACAPALIVLSARTEERLKAQAHQLLNWLNICPALPAIEDIAWTLQVGRHPMLFRLGALACGISELRGQIRSYLDGADQIPGLRHGKSLPRGNGKVSTELTHAAMTPAERIRQGQTIEVLEAWVNGEPIDWSKHRAGAVRRQCNLPVYPFERERYWMPDAPGQQVAAAAAQFHPLLHRNTSILRRQRYTSTFTGEEFFFADHQIRGRRVLPAAACLEMVRAAVEHAVEPAAGVRLENVAWPHQLAAGETTSDVHVALNPTENGSFQFEIYSDTAEAGGNPVVYCTGGAVLEHLDERPAIDLTILQTRCREQVMDIEEFYRVFRSDGLNHGPAYRGLEGLAIGLVAPGRSQALARLALPKCVADTHNSYVLHPSIIDAALQATAALSNCGQGIPNLPFAVEKVRMWSGSPAQGWASVRFSAGSKAGESTQKFDIDIADDAGLLCVSLTGFTVRALEKEVVARTALLRPEWREQAAAQATALPFGSRWVVLCDQMQTHRQQIEAALPGVHCIQFALQEDPAASYEAAVIQLIGTLRAILQQMPRERTLMQVLGTHGGFAGVFEALSGALRTAQLENPKVLGQVIGFEAGADASSVIAKLQENARAAEDSEIRYIGGERQVLDWVETAASGTGLLWRDGGVYLITGGTGRLGLIFAREIAKRVSKPVLVLTGRTGLNTEKQAALRALEQAGARIVYESMDASDHKAFSALVAHICEAYGSLTGVLHCAGVIRDRFLVNTTADDVRAVLAPKVGGVMVLDEATRNLPLEFIILFGSIAGVLGNTGQAGYAAGNAFLDAYAVYRNGLVGQGLRCGRTLAVSWSLWLDGGMQMDEAAARMLRTRGLVPLATEAGIQALYDAWAGGMERVLVLSGDVERIRSYMMRPGVSSALDSAAENAMPALTDQRLEEKTHTYLRKVLGTALKLPADRIGLDSAFESYGIDSVLVMSMTSEMEQSLGPLPKTLFFEYQNLRDLLGYFLETHRGRLLEIFGTESLPPSPSNRDGDALATVSPVRNNRLLQVQEAHSDSFQRRADGPLDIAIIGLSGRYAGARNVQEFWENLCQGRDCIREIPAERWDHSEYFDTDKNKPGKTYTKWGGFIDGVAEFDPQFFGISPREAAMMDPQERLFLQCAHEAIEDAGYTRETLDAERPSGASVGVYAGVMYQEYQLYGMQNRAHGSAISGGIASIANRVSYTNNFNGPSLAIDTMCSSSLTAIYLACQALATGDCKLAIAGGVNLSIHPNKYLLLGQGRFASSKGRCESFGEGGEGYVPGEGVGAVLLKPLRRAVADGDSIYGVIKAVAVNHGGRTNGYTVPSPVAQAAVIESALLRAKIDPRDVSYVEAHGTGTSLGDPIEIAGLTRAFRNYTADKQFCAIGSVKSNIGHCESAAGIAGLTKVLLQMKHGQLVPSLHAGTLNPHIDFVNSPFAVQRSLAEWRRPVVVNAEKIEESPRIATVSAFGAGGSNAHLVIEEYTGPVRETVWSSPVLVVLSAKNEARLREYAERLMTAIKTYPLQDADLADMAYTLQTGREAMEVRLGLLADNMAEVRGKLDAYLRGEDGIGNFCHGEVERSDHLAVLADDSDMALAIETWIAKGKLGKILDLWVKGMPFAWSRLYAERRPRRISLPAYPFARVRYWAGEGFVAPTPATDARQHNHPPYDEICSGEYGADGAEESQLVVATAPSHPELPTRPALPGAQTSRLLARMVEAMPAEREEMMAQFIQAQIAKLLEFPPQEIPGLQQGFFDMGMESVMVEQFRSSLERDLAIELSASAIFDHPTILQLSRHVLSLVPLAAFEDLPHDPVQASVHTLSTNCSMPPVEDPELMEDPELEQIAEELQSVLVRLSAMGIEGGAA